MFLRTTAIAALLLLTACGGGGQPSNESISTAGDCLPDHVGQCDDTPTGNSPHDDTMVEAPETRPSAELSIQSQLEDLIDQSTVIRSASTIATFEPGSLWHPVDVRGVPSDLDIEHLTDHGLSDVTFTLREDGPIALADIQRARNTETFQYHALATWGKHHMGLVRTSIIADTHPLRNTKNVFHDGHVLGAESGSNPNLGTLIWTGRAIGTDVSDSDTQGDQVIGEATLTLNNSSLDVRLHGLQASGRNLRELTWTDILLTDGTFSDVGLSGSLYGPAHDEAGGIFIQTHGDGQSVAGVFSAAR